MDRGEVHTNVRTNTTDIQICRLDLGDQGGPGGLFLTAARADDLEWNDPGPDEPVDINDLDRTWPECTTVDELDELIAALQAERAWMTEPDPEKRRTM